MRERISTKGRRALLATLAVLLAAGAIAFRFVPRRGVVKNDSKHALWVVDTDGGSAVAHRLEPGRQSPRGLDADGVRAVDETPIDGHASWWKARDVSVALIAESERGELTLSCIACSAVHDAEFGSVRYDPAPDWGDALHD